MSLESYSLRNSEKLYNVTKTKQLFPQMRNDVTGPHSGSRSVGQQANDSIYFIGAQTTDTQVSLQIPYMQYLLTKFSFKTDEIRSFH